ncbi:MAG: S1 family peptidase [Acidimicrobiia bacterium]|nr:S1 family peptidase [Acidimicrobiia bacterium]
MRPRPAQKTVDGAIERLHTLRARWHRQPGVTAVDVGFKITEDVMTEEVALRVHVERKIPVDELPESQRFNVSGGPTTEVDGYKVDVIEASYGVLRNQTISVLPTVAGRLALEDDAPRVDRRALLRPLLGGISCGNPRITSGTIGAIVFHRRTCKPMILSNWHVLAGDRVAATGEPIVQPGPTDGGRAGDEVARLSAMVLDSRMDAAVAEIEEGIATERELLGLGTITGTETARLGTKVAKSGRTTSLTKGIVDGVSLSTRINYGGGVAQSFVNQIRIVPRPPWPAINDEISSGGDSGSVWINEANNRALGLHFAGENDPAVSAENAIASPIDPIMDEFGISFAPVVYSGRDRAFDLCREFPFLCEPQFDELRRLLERLGDRLVP